MSMFKRKRRKMPGLNTAAMPDLVFTVLFFFMIVTHLKEVPEKMDCELPEAGRLDQIPKKSEVLHLIVGWPYEQTVQLNDHVIPIERIGEAIAAEREKMSPEERQRLTVSIRADRRTPMSVINEVKQALRRSNTLRIHYSADLVMEKR